MTSRKQRPSETILVTGCAGFIGSNFVKKTKEENPKLTIVGIDDFSSGKTANLDKSIIFYKGSIAEKNLLEKIFKKNRPKYIFHFAAMPRVSYSIEHPAETSTVNIGGTVNLLDLSVKYKIKRFIFSSSAAVYGEAKNLPTDENEKVNPKSPYALQKYTGEWFCKIYSDLFNLDTVCLRYFNVFGPRQYGDSPYSTVISLWLEYLYLPKKGKTIFLEGDGKQSRDFCYVDNVILANQLAMLSGKKFKGEIFNIGNGNRINLQKVYKLLKKFSGKNFILEKRGPRPGDVRHSQADIKKAKKYLGYKPLYNFEDGLEKTVEWFKERSKNEK